MATDVLMLTQDSTRHIVSTKEKDFIESHRQLEVGEYDEFDEEG